MQDNNDALCRYYKAYYATTDPKERIMFEQKLSGFLVGTGRMAGYGVYFAENPTDSAVEYGPILVVAAVRPNVTVSVYRDNTNAVNVTQAILSAYDGVVYKWSDRIAMALRGHSILSVDDKNRILAASFNFTPNEVRREIWKLQPYAGPWALDRVIDLYRDFIYSSLYQRGKFEENGTLTATAKMWFISWQWNNPFEQSWAACHGNRALCMGVAYAINADDMHDINWNETTSLLVAAEYLTPSDVASIAPGDLKMLRQYLMARFDEKDVNMVALDFVRNYLKLQKIQPGMSTWRYY